jgi:hypothetical protein
MRKINRSQVKDFLKKTNGHFFSVEFVKKDGTVRKLVGRTGVKKYLKGGENKVEGPGRPYVTVYDVQNKGYRTVNANTVQSIKFGNDVLLVEDN